MVQSAPSKTVQLGDGIRVPYISDTVPCWTESKLNAALKGTFADPAAMVEYLEEQGHLLQLKCDRYKAEQESFVYVPFSVIPEQPETQVCVNIYFTWKLGNKTYRKYP